LERDVGGRWVGKCGEVSVILGDGRSFQWCDHFHWFKGAFFSDIFQIVKETIEKNLCLKCIVMILATNGSGALLNCAAAL
jgi:hypothetical protein